MKVDRQDISLRHVGAPDTCENGARKRHEALVNRRHAITIALIQRMHYRELMEARENSAGEVS